MTASYLNKASGKLVLEYNVAGPKGEKPSYYLYQQEPLRLLFLPLRELGVQGAMLLNLSGGIPGGDHHHIDLCLKEKSSLFLTSQAAERIYGSKNLASALHFSMTVHDHAWGEWFPQETILFNEGRVKRNFAFHLEEKGQLIAADMVVLGRLKRGEAFEKGHFHDTWKVYRNNQLLWVDAFHLKEPFSLQALYHPAGLNHAKAYGTFIYGAYQAEMALRHARQLLESFRLNPQVMKVYASAFQHIIIVRFLAHDPVAMKEAMILFWLHWRQHVGNLPAVRPRFLDF